MSDPLPPPMPDRITIPVTLTKDDYLRYFAIASKHERPADWTDTLVYIAAYVAAIPVAILFRWWALGDDGDTVTANMVGQFSLFAFFLGEIAMVLASVVIRRRAIDKTLDGTINAYGPKTVVLDHDGVTMTGQISQSRWQWAAIGRFVVDGGFVLLWIGRSPVIAIADRSFENAGARDAAIAFVRARMAAVTSRNP